MTERHEVISLYSQLEDILDETLYEAKSKPGEGPEVAQLLFMAAENIALAREALKQADQAMAAKGKSLY